MSDNIFEFQFNQLLSPEERIFKLSSAEFGEDETLSVSFLLDAKNYDDKLDSKLKGKVYKTVCELIPPVFKAKIFYKKTISDPEHIKKEVLTFFYNSSSFLFQALSNSEIDVGIGYDSIIISIKLNRDVYSYINDSKYVDNLAMYLDGLFLETSEIVLIPNDIDEGDSLPIKSKRNKIENIGVRTIEIAIADIFSGSIKKAPRYICDITSMANSTVTLCGKVSKVEERVSKNGKKYFTFNINDSTANIKIMYFARTENIYTKFAFVKDNDTVVIEGELKSTDGKTNFYVLTSAVARCNIDFSSIHNETVYLDYPEEYEKIFPKNYEDKEQVNLFEGAEDNEKLKGDFVIFDLETTGLSATNNMITEIGAVKMRDGVIIETFTTLIDPEVKLSAEIIAITGITDQMLENAPKFNEVIADFYKFTQNATLVAQNASFDMSFISYHGQKCNYKFENEVLDTIALAKEKVFLKKYNLSFMCDHFHISLIGAHRAINDALATAKLFKTLVNYHSSRKK